MSKYELRRKCPPFYAASLDFVLLLDQRNLDVIEEDSILSVDPSAVLSTPYLCPPRGYDAVSTTNGSGSHRDSEWGDFEGTSTRIPAFTTTWFGFALCLAQSE